MRKWSFTDAASYDESEATIHALMVPICGHLVFHQDFIIRGDIIKRSNRGYQSNAPLFQKFHRKMRHIKFERLIYDFIFAKMR